MRDKKKYEKPKIIDTAKLEAIAGVCTGPGGKATSQSCSLIMS